MTYEELNFFIVVFQIILLIYFSVKKAIKLMRSFQNRKLSEADRS